MLDSTDAVIAPLMLLTGELSVFLVMWQSGVMWWARPSARTFTTAFIEHTDK